MTLPQPEVGPTARFGGLQRALGGTLRDVIPAVPPDHAKFLGATLDALCRAGRPSERRCGGPGASPDLALRHGSLSTCADAPGVSRR